MNNKNHRDPKWDPDRYAEHARFVSDLGRPVLEYLAPQPGERILDLGCGDGALTHELAELGCDVIGVDASPEMVAAAVARGVDARIMSGEALEFQERFEAVFSNAALHWMKAPAAVIEGVWRALVTGGRFVAEFGGHGNIAAILQALESALTLHDLEVERPWYFPRPEEYKDLLTAGGFSVQEIDLFPRPTRLPGGMADWLETFAQAYTNSLPSEEKEVLVSEVVDELRPILCNKDGEWTADYVRIRFSAIKPKRVA